MGFGKLNIWVRNTACEVVDRAGHLHVYNCHGKLILPITWFQHGHIEVQVPPGCYIVQAGVVYGNIYTDRTMVIVRCGEDICVNLVLAQFLAPLPPELVVQPLVLYNCPAAMATALVANSFEAGIKQEELTRAIDVIAKAARIDKAKMLDEVKKEVSLLEENMKQFTEKEQVEVKKYTSLAKKIL